jgi:hypothetical protein
MSCEWGWNGYIRKVATNYSRTVSKQSIKHVVSSQHFKVQVSVVTNTIKKEIWTAFTCSTEEHAVAHLVKALRYKPGVAGSIRHGVNGIFHWNNPSGRNMGSTQPLTEMGKGGPCVGLTTLPPSCADCLEILESQTLGALRVCRRLYRDCFSFISCDGKWSESCHTAFQR